MSEDMDGKAALQTILAGKPDDPSENIMRCVASMLSDIDHGKCYETIVLAEMLNVELGSLQFHYDLSEVNQLLEQKGYHLTSRGKHGKAFAVETINRSSGVVSMLNKKAMKALKRSVLFAHGVLMNHGDKLNESQKKRLEKQSEIQALRYILAKRLR